MNDKQTKNAFVNTKLRSQGSFKNSSVQIIHPKKDQSKSYFNNIEICLNDDSSEESES